MSMSNRLETGVHFRTQFGNQATRNMILSWLTSYAITIAIVEPFFVRAHVPMLISHLHLHSMRTPAHRTSHTPLPMISHSLRSPI